jgi:hypothetical protein
VDHVPILFSEINPILTPYGDEAEGLNNTIRGVNESQFKFLERT